MLKFVGNSLCRDLCSSGVTAIKIKCSKATYKNVYVHFGLSGSVCPFRKLWHRPTNQPTDGHEDS